MGAHEMSGGRNIQQSGGSMPLFTVTMKSNRSTSEKDRLSRAIHAASIAAGYPEDDLFQRFLSLGPRDLRVDLYYPALPKPRTDQMLMIEVMVCGVGGCIVQRSEDEVRLRRICSMRKLSPFISRMCTRWVHSLLTLYS